MFFPQTLVSDSWVILSLVSVIQSAMPELSSIRFAANRNGSEEFLNRKEINIKAIKFML